MNRLLRAVRWLVSAGPLTGFVGVAYLVLAGVLYFGFIDDPVPVRESSPPLVNYIDRDRHLIGRTDTQIVRYLCSSRNVTLQVHRTLTDGAVITIPDTAVLFADGCRARARPFPVPTILPPNIPVTYEVTLSGCNILRCVSRKLAPVMIVVSDDSAWPPTDPPPPVTGAAPL